MLARPQAVRFGSRLALTFGVLFAACGPGGASPIPQPPILAVPTDKLSTEPPDGSARQFPFVLGALGAAIAGSTLRVTNLDDAEAPSEAPVAANGSFRLEVVSSPGDELRFEVLSADGRRSPPTDASLNNDYTLSRSPRFDCLSFFPPLWVAGEAGETVRLEVENACGSDVGFDSARFRLAPESAAVATPLPLTIAAGERGEIEIVLSDAAGADDNVLLLDVTSAASTIRYPVTITQLR